MAAHARSRGWAMWAGAGTCAGCRQPVMPPKQRLGVGNGAGATAATGGSPGGANSKGMGMVKGAVREIVGVEDGADENEEPRKITIMRTEIAYHRLVYRVSTLSHNIQHCHMVS